MSDPPSRLRRFLHSAAVDLEADIDRIEDALSAGEGHTAKVRLLAYAGYRNAHEVRLSGRIVRHKPPLDAGEGTLSRLRAMMEIYNSHELPGVAVRCEAYGQVVEAVTDEEGYFAFVLPVDRPLPPATAWAGDAVDARPRGAAGADRGAGDGARRRP